MSLNSNISNWLTAYNAVPFQTSQDPKYIGSILGTNGQFHTGIGVYNPQPATGLDYEIYDFNWYAGQGLHSGISGGKYLLHSENGLSWDTADRNSNNLYEFETTGTLNTLYLGYNADTGDSPLQGTLTAFNATQSLLVVNNFNVAVDYVAGLFGGTDGNSQILSSALVDANGKSLITYPQYYEKVTLNSAIIYDLAFEAAASDYSTFEYVLDAYLSGFSSGAIDLDSDIGVINTYLSNNGSDLSFEYYAQAGSYAPGGVITSAAAEVESDLLLAA